MIPHSSRDGNNLPDFSPHGIHELEIALSIDQALALVLVHGVNRSGTLPIQSCGLDFNLLAFKQPRSGCEYRSITTTNIYKHIPLIPYALLLK